MSGTVQASLAEFGPTEVQPLSRLQGLVSRALATSWTTIPHVTHHDSVDVTQLEEFRAGVNAGSGNRISPLPFLIKAIVAALKEFPKFNSSLDPAGNLLVLKRYFNIGFATDTPHGLIVPVIRDCDGKDLDALSGEISDLASRARGRGLPLKDLTGGCFTISSLGALGGTGFTPIISAPEVAILGVSRTTLQATADASGGVTWRKMLPLSLSYDHRVINGADAGRFMQYLAGQLSDPQRLAGEINAG